MLFSIQIMDNSFILLATINNQVSGTHPNLQNQSHKYNLIQNGKVQEKLECSKKSYQLRQNCQLQFKVCIFQNNIFKFWEHYHPMHQNRKFKADCKSITLLIIENNQSLIQEKRFINFSSKEISSLPVRKYTTKVQEQLEDQSNSSSSGVNDYYQIKQTIKPLGAYQYNINSLVTTFRFIINQGWVKSHLAPEKSEILKKLNSDQFHIISRNALFYIHSQLTVNNSKRFDNVTFVNLTFQNFEDWIVKTESFCKKIILDEFFTSKQNIHQYAHVLCGQIFSLVPKYLKKLSQTIKYRLILYFDRLSDLINDTLILDPSVLLESIFLVDCLQFANLTIFDDFIYFIEKYGIFVHLENLNDHNFVLVCNMNAIVVKIKKLTIIENEQLNTVNYIQLTHRISKNEKNLPNLMLEYQKLKNNRIIVFHFGRYENFEILQKNRDLLLKLNKDNMIYAFTCNRLQNYRTIIQNFTHIVFISHTYLEIAYNKKIYYLLNKHTIQNELKDLICILEEELSIFPSFNMSIRQNTIYIDSGINNKQALECLQNLYQRLKDLINLFNEEQQKNVTIKRINKSTIQISKEYQTEYFFSNLIFKNLETPPEFLIVFLFDRIANFKFQEEIANAIKDKQSHYLSNINYFCYDIQNHYNNTFVNHLSTNEFIELLMLMSNASTGSKKQNQSKNLGGNGKNKKQSI